MRRPSGLVGWLRVGVGVAMGTGMGMEAGVEQDSNSGCLGPSKSKL